MPTTAAAAPSPRYREETEEYEAAAGEDAFAVALQSLRIATQYHLMFTGGQDRDESMAENTVWIAERPGPESRLVLWAHNNHLAKLPSWAQGFFLREAFGDDMVVVGFSHEGGRFTAVGQGSETCSGLSEFDLEPPPPESCEWYLASASAPRFVLDLRAADTSAAGAAWLGEARPFRSIGCCSDPSSPDRYWSLHRFGADLRLTERFDVLIHHESTRATAILPWRSPCTF